MSYKYLLFDADDTILNFKEDERIAISALFTEYGIPVTPLLIEMYSEINISVWKEYERQEIEKKDIGKLRFQRLLEKINHKGDSMELDRRYKEHLSATGTAIEDAHSICRELISRGYKLYIVSNGMTEILTKRLRKSQLDQYFNHVFISEQLGHQKPKTEFFDEVFKLIGSENKADYLIIGDSLTSDIRGGKNAGIATCWFNIRNSDELPEVSPDYTITSLTRLKDFL